MKKQIFSFLLVFVCLLVTGCFSVGKNQSKTSFLLDEEGAIDHFKVTLIDFRKKDVTALDWQLRNDLVVSYKFRIKNESTNQVEIDPSAFFKLNGAGEAVLLTKEKILVPSQKTIEYEVLYDVKTREDYPILFYSGTVGNNIEFIGRL